MNQKRLDIDGDVFDCVFCGTEFTFASVAVGEDHFDYCQECRDRIIADRIEELLAAPQNTFKRLLVVCKKLRKKNDALNSRLKKAMAVIKESERGE